MIKTLLTSLVTLVLSAGLVNAQSGSTVAQVNNQVVTGSGSTIAKAPSSPEFDLNLEGIGAQSELKNFAEQWRQSRAKEGKIYGVAVGTAQIKSKPGQNTYGDAYMLALDEAILIAHSNYISEVVKNDISSQLRATSRNRTGFDEAAAEAECQANNRAKLDAKLAAVANQLANKVIDSLGGSNDKSTNFAEGVKCEFEKLVSEMARSFTIKRQLAIRGARTLKVAIDGQTVSVANAYGQPGLELADIIRAQKPSDQPNPNAREEIIKWVDANLLDTPEVLPSAGVRSFKLSNGEWVIVSLSISGLPHQGNMSKAEIAHRNQAALEKADSLALEALNRFAGAAVRSETSSDDLARYAAMFEVEIKDGMVSASFDQEKVSSEFSREIRSVSRGQLRGSMSVKNAARKSELAGGNVAYAVRAWSPSLLSQARAFESNLQQNHAAPKPAVSAQGGSQQQKGTSKTMKEDW